MRRGPATLRYFGGRTYHLDSAAVRKSEFGDRTAFFLDSATTRKKEAVSVAKYMRRRGRSVRVVPYKQPGVTWYLLYIRLGKQGGR